MPGNYADIERMGDNGALKVIYVPDTSVDVYKSADGWSSQAAKIQPLSTYAGFD